MHAARVILRGFIYGFLVGVCAVFLALCMTWMMLLFTHSETVGYFSFVTTAVGIFVWGIWPQR